MISTRRLAAIMFTDLVGYSALTQRNEPLALELVETKRTLLAPLLAQHKGTLIKSLGDGLLIEFPSALQAVHCAVAIQSMLKGYNNSQPEEHQINVRIGIHLGDVEFQNGDVMGDGVNIASRIEPLAEPGGICISGAVYDQVDGKLKAKFESLGKPELKNIEKEIEIFKVSSQEIEDDNVITEADASKRSQLLKIGSVVAIGIVTIIAAWLILSVLFGPAQTNSLAVLPFADLSPDQDLAYLSEGLAEEIRNAIGKIDGMNVIGRESSEIVKQRNLSTREAAAFLDVQSVLEGSVQKSGSRFRITARLVKGSDDTELWSEQFDREESELFEIMEEIASDILIKLGYAFGPDNQIVEAGTTNIRAYKAYLEGRYQWNRYTEDGMQQAIAYFEDAITQDPRFALAHAWLSDSYFRAGPNGWGILSLDESYKNSLLSAEEALEIDESLGEGHYALGMNRYWREFNSTEGEREFEEAIKLNPKDPLVRYMYAGSLFELGRIEEATLHLEEGLKIDPFSYRLNRLAAGFMSTLGRYDEAEIHADRMIEINPNFYSYDMDIDIKIRSSGWDAAEDELKRFFDQNALSSDLHLIYANYLIARGRYDIGNSELNKAVEISSQSPFVMGEAVWSAHKARAFDVAIQLFDRILAVNPHHSDANDYFNVSLAHIASGEIEKGFEMNLRSWELRHDITGELARGFRQAFESSGWQGYLNSLDSYLSQLRAEPCSYREEVYAELLTYALMENSAKTIQCLDVDFNHRFGQVSFLSLGRNIQAQEFDFLRTDPRFVEIVGMLGLEN